LRGVPERMTGPLSSPRALLRALTPGDGVVCGLVLLGAIALAAFARGGGHGATHAVVTVGRDEVAVLSLAAPGATRVEGKLGPVVLEVEGGAIRVAESGCPHHVCIAMGAKSRSGDILACAPNALVVRLTGGAPDADAPDAVSR
ncbi:NusG domain II-containing protein, partial [bacterium]|nr:NusG domain II-containing protein [bacterium]